jgi:hypothetical protein
MTDGERQRGAIRSPRANGFREIRGCEILEVTELSVRFSYAGTRYMVLKSQLQEGADTILMKGDKDVRIRVSNHVARERGIV